VYILSGLQSQKSYVLALDYLIFQKKGIVLATFFVKYCLRRQLEKAQNFATLRSGVYSCLG